MPETRRKLLDSWAILALLHDEEGADAVADLLHAAIESDEPLLVNEINVGEVYYVVAKHRSVEAAERVLDHLETLPLELVSNAFDDVLEAARIRARHPLAWADATVVTGDREFEAVEGIVPIEWL